MRAGDPQYPVTVPADGAERFRITIKRKASSAEQGCVSPRVFEQGGLDPDSGFIGVNQDPNPPDC